MHDIWNPWHGCHKCSPGCENCYMYALDKMRGVEKPSNEVFKTRSFQYPLSKNRQGEYKVKSGERIRVNMTSDTFVEEADEWRDEMWDIIRKRPDVIFWLLTKRPERILEHLPSDWGDGYDNVSMNVTCENQAMFDKRFPILFDIPAKHKGLCLAPLIGPIDVTKACQSGQMDEISCGGENYDNPRPIHHEWVESISKTCYDYRVNFCWYETGTKLIKDGKFYFIPTKAQQGVQAFLSGLSHYWNDIHFDLKMPDGTPVVLKHEKKYNVNKCLFCANQLMCNGCSGCGDCGTTLVLLESKAFFELQNKRSVEMNRPDLVVSL